VSPVSGSRVTDSAPRVHGTSLWLTWAAFVLAVCAALAVFAYLQPARNGTWVSLAVAVNVLFAPLLARPPWTRGRILVSALVWLVLGFLGGYFFGTPVVYAGVLLGAATLAEQLVRRVRLTAPSTCVNWLIRPRSLDHVPDAGWRPSLRGAPQGGSRSTGSGLERPEGPTGREARGGAVPCPRPYRSPALSLWPAQTRLRTSCRPHWR